MKNLKLIKVALFLFLGFLLIVSYFGPCDSKVMKCLGGNSIFLTRTLVHLVIPAILSVAVLLLLSDSIFKKWIKFAVGWIFVSLIAIAATPEYGGGFLDPDREQVSIWMSSLFLIISIILMIVWSVKERNKK